MKRILLFVVFLGAAAPSYSQFVAILTNLTPLYIRCDSACGPIVEGHAEIYWDQNMNGPDGADVQPVVGNGFAQCNFNSIDMASGIDLLGIPGTFATDPAFTISTTTPQPSRYYIKVYAAGESVWQSNVFTINDGLNDIIVEGWTCLSIWSVPPLQEDSIHIEYDGGFHSFCVAMVEGLPTKICYGPVEPGFLPLVYVTPGCTELIFPSCSPCQGPVDFWFDPEAWQYDQVNASLCNWIIPQGIGCVHYDEDSHIPVQFGSFTAESRDQSVLLTWSTQSERSIRIFIVRRDGIEIYTAEPANTAVGATYTYLDEGLENGRSYTYGIDVVNMDGTVQAWPTIASASPSAGRAVVDEYALHQNYPNPFNPSTNIVYDLVNDDHVLLTVYDVTGREVAVLVNGTVSAGRHTVSFDASGFTSGEYFYTVRIGINFAATKKMLLVK